MIAWMVVVLASGSNFISFSNAQYPHCTMAFVSVLSNFGWSCSTAELTTGSLIVGQSAGSCFESLLGFLQVTLQWTLFTIMWVRCVYLRRRVLTLLRRHQISTLSHLFPEAPQVRKSHTRGFVRLLSSGG